MMISVTTHGWATDVYGGAEKKEEEVIPLCLKRMIHQVVVVYDV